VRPYLKNNKTKAEKAWSMAQVYSACLASARPSSNPPVLPEKKQKERRKEKKAGGIAQ
jgi:hypothetical protein